jgi:D-alanyl-D-alanine carboxypeptidase/D-alanyl-D-alanine-endopeptidase (penicillin-binding protein 4)
VTRPDAVRRGLVAVLLVVATAAVVLARRGPDGEHARAAGSRLATPLWSARRVPQAVVDGVGQQRLQGALAAQAAGTDACFAVSGADGAVAGAATDRPLVPASTQKLLTATAALARLGPDFRYETRAVAAHPVDGGTVERLYLVGSGDPIITTPEAAAALARDPLTAGDATTPLADLADQLVAAGVRRIPGGVTGDDRRYDDTRYLPQWPASYRADAEIGPIGALTVNDGFTGVAGEGAAAGDPALNAADQLARLLAARGVEVGPSGHGRAPEDATTIATLRSPPLPEVLTELLASSDNLTAEMLAREVAVAAGRPGTTPDGTRTIVDTLTHLGLPTAGTVMTDGSGLAREDRTTCALLLAVLGRAADPKFATLHDGLAVAGQRGTLATRLAGSSLAGTLRAKTGSLSGVTGLAGFVDVDRALRFALLANGSFGESGGVALRERMAQTIAGYPDAPPPEVLVPMPLAPTRAAVAVHEPPSNEACPSSAAAC